MVPAPEAGSPSFSPIAPDFVLPGRRGVCGAGAQACAEAALEGEGEQDKRKSPPQGSPLLPTASSRAQVS